MSLGTAYGAIFDEKELEALLAQHLPQVRYLARHIHDRLPKHVQLDDLVHAGVVGLLDALRKFDPRKEVQFKTYSKFRIRGAILDSLRDMDWGPRDLRRKGRMVEDATARLAVILGREPNERELADELSMSLDELQRLLGELGGLDLGSLQGVGEGDNEYDLGELIPASPDETPYAMCEKSEMRARLAEAISELSEREQQVLSLYYYEELTMKDIGEVLSVGESRVSQIHSLAVTKLRARLRNFVGHPFAAANGLGEMECRRY